MTHPHQGSGQNEPVNRTTKRSRSPVRTPVPASSLCVPLSSALLSSKLRCRLDRIWHKARRDEEGHICAGGGSASRDSNASFACGMDVIENLKVAEVPNFKVGSLEMYRRFPQQYDVLMSRHNCSAVEAYLHGVLDVLGETAGHTQGAGHDWDPATGFVTSGSPHRPTAPRCIHVGDFGCGTGRIACMLAKHTAVDTLYCYDSEAAMLRECFVNVVRTVAVSRLDVDAVRILPSGDCSCSADEFVSIGSNRCNSDTNKNTAGDAVVKLCVRPISFDHVMKGHLRTHPPCRLIVCAWSLSYVMRACWGEDRWHGIVDATLMGLLDLLGTATPSAPCALVIIETLGTNTVEPRRENTLTKRLESHYGFERRWVRTDYNFNDMAEAVRLTRFFFGDSMAKRLEATGSTTLPECTGIWTLWKK
ncbi:hypothetical protein ERJ75_001523300 [Trypanosoma vivax]|uniref:Methyltransferase n=1 Tax=Trypanosoma vivax (strain Y486) TaxID=1055687 RepID=G0UBA6_TRYVY|nr:hypothetical protein TRVL_03188 [Trypanosoma vivax]KAH8606253.1 hypothetical protein ERJ75_001523300 [Trypanosoma vivax]CCC53093.1 conserved hypothetical protein [Trypanosoma vivax Y486]